MVYLVVPEERLLELFRLPKRSIVERLIGILKNCGQAVSDSDTVSDAECDNEDPVKRHRPSCGSQADDEGVESNERGSRSFSPDKDVAGISTKIDVVGS